MLLLGTLHIKEQEGKGHYNKFHNDILSRKDFPHETFTVRSPVCWHPLTAEHSSVLWTETQLDNVRISAENCANFFNSVHCQAMLHAHSHFFLVIKEKNPSEKLFWKLGNKRQRIHKLDKKPSYNIHKTELVSPETQVIHLHILFLKCWAIKLVCKTSVVQTILFLAIEFRQT